MITILARLKVGPQVPGARPKMMKNTFTGYVEAGEVSDFQFETQRRTFSAFGYALDPSVSGQTSTQTFIGDVDKAIEKKGDDIITSRGKPRAQKRRRETRGDAADIDGYKGPWAKFEDEKTTAAPSEEQTDQLVLWGKSKQQKTEDGSAKPTGREEKSILHSASPPRPSPPKPHIMQNNRSMNVGAVASRSPCPVLFLPPSRRCL